MINHNLILVQRLDKSNTIPEILGVFERAVVIKILDFLGTICIRIQKWVGKFGGNLSPVKGLFWTQEILCCRFWMSTSIQRIKNTEDPFQHWMISVTELKNWLKFHSLAKLVPSSGTGWKHLVGYNWHSSLQIPLNNFGARKRPIFSAKWWHLKFLFKAS